MDRSNRRHRRLLAGAGAGALVAACAMAVTAWDMGDRTDGPEIPGLDDRPAAAETTSGPGTSQRSDPSGSVRPAAGEVPLDVRGLDVLLVDGSLDGSTYHVVLGAPEPTPAEDLLGDGAVSRASSITSVDVGFWGTLVTLEGGAAWSLPVGALDESDLLVPTADTSGESGSSGAPPAVVAGPDGPRTLTSAGLERPEGADAAPIALSLPPDVTPLRVLTTDPPSVLARLVGTQELWILHPDRRELVARGVVARAGSVGSFGMLVVGCEAPDCGVEIVGWNGDRVAADDTVTRMLLGGGDVAVSPDGRRAVVVDAASGKAVILDLATGRVTVTWSAGDDGSGPLEELPGDGFGPPAWDPSGRYVLLPGGANGIILLDAFLGGVTIVDVTLPTGTPVAAVIPVVR
ncbi:MAG: hypothetical protein S0880_26775 [Actinomycetota bacterium]|nr:hypothetical protein [Actinomycetota bacterium]